MILSKAGRAGYRDTEVWIIKAKNIPAQELMASGTVKSEAKWSLRKGGSAGNAHGFK